MTPYALAEIVAGEAEYRHWLRTQDDASAAGLPTEESPDDEWYWGDMVAAEDDEGAPW